MGDMACSSTSTPDDKEAIDCVNLFTEPHNRMKELVSWPLTEAAKVSDVHDLEPSLQAIYEAMWEMKTHEYIENHYIMDRLKQRLQSRRVYNELVCNCHEDSKLLDVIGLVEKVYHAHTQRLRVKYGRRLQKSIQGFLHEFMHHMEEEEAVFQPLLVENFEPKELADMKEIVQKQHSLFREKVKSEKSLKALKRKSTVQPQDLDFGLEDLQFRKSYCQEVNDHLKKQTDDSGQLHKGEDAAAAVVAKKSKLGEEDDVTPSSSSEGIFHWKTSTQDLPEEILVLIFSLLGPKALLASASVNRRWRIVVFSSVFWRALYPTQWARGQWSFDYIPPDLKALSTFSTLSSTSSSLASSNESLDSVDSVDSVEDDDGQPSDPVRGHTMPDDKLFSGIGEHLLPKIGPSVSTMILSASSTLSDEHVKALLRQVPNIRHINLSYTHISSDGFEGLFKYGALQKLEELILCGCIKVGDSLFAHLGRCFLSTATKRRPSSRSKIRRLNLSGCRSITSVALEHLVVHASTLQELDLSGCYKVDGGTLCLFVDKCPRLRPERLAYCNDIEDGPFQDTANGCLNLECEIRFCCQQLRN